MTHFNKNIRYVNSLQALQIPYISYQKIVLMLKKANKKT